MIKQILDDLKTKVIETEGILYIDEDVVAEFAIQKSLASDKMCELFEKLERLNINVVYELDKYLANKEGESEVFENIVFKGNRRYYVEDLSQRDYMLEHTTPQHLCIRGHIIEERSWGNLLCKTTELLLELFSECKDKLLTFKCEWSKQAMFTLEEKTNFKPIKGGLFMNCNHTALHACWLLQDLLDYFGINKAGVYFLIHRPSGAEPQKVRDYIEKRFKKNFAEFLCAKYKKTNEQAEKIIHIIAKYLNPMLQSVSKSYTNFFLFADNTILANYTKRVREKVAIDRRLDEKARGVLNKYLDYLVQYYKSS